MNTGLEVIELVSLELEHELAGFTVAWSKDHVYNIVNKARTKNPEGPAGVILTGRVRHPAKFTDVAIIRVAWWGEASRCAVQRWALPREKTPMRPLTWRKMPPQEAAYFVNEARWLEEYARPLADYLANRGIKVENNNYPVSARLVRKYRVGVEIWEVSYWNTMTVWIAAPRGAYAETCYCPKPKARSYIKHLFESHPRVVLAARGAIEADDLAR